MRVTATVPAEVTPREVLARTQDSALQTVAICADPPRIVPKRMPGLERVVPPDRDSTVMLTAPVAGKFVLTVAETRNKSVETASVSD